jgi:hypothetical protein
MKAGSLDGGLPAVEAFGAHGWVARCFRQSADWFKL